MSADSELRGRSVPAEQPVLRSVAVPSEHGGWMLTLEPVLLGLLVAPSPAGLWLGLAALGAFLARTPLRVVLVDRHRGRRLRRTIVAGRLLALESVAIVGCAAMAIALSGGPIWIPAMIAAPLVAVELGYDMRSRSRRLVPELAGAIGVGAVVAMIVLAAGGDLGLGMALWLVVTARATTTIPHIRGQIDRIHDRTPSARLMLVADVAAMAVAATAVLVDPATLAGAVTIAAIVAYQRIVARGPVPRPGGIGAHQVVLGLTLVLVAGLGALAP